MKCERFTYDCLSMPIATGNSNAALFFPLCCRVLHNQCIEYVYSFCQSFESKSNAIA